MKWFGPPWPSSKTRAMVCEDEDQHVRVPVGRPCGGDCGTNIMGDDQGVLMPYLGPGCEDVLDQPWHVDCLMRTFMPTRPYVGP